MNISLTPIREEFVRRKLSTGLYNSASEVSREAWHVLEERDQLRDIRVNALRKQIAVGLDQLRRGEASEHDDQSLDTLAADVKAKGRQNLGTKEKRWT